MNNSELIINFAKKMGKDISKDTEKFDWSKSDIWWLFSYLGKEVNSMDRAITNNDSANLVEEKAVSIANLAMIIANKYSSIT